MCLSPVLHSAALLQLRADPFLTGWSPALRKQRLPRYHPLHGQILYHVFYTSYLRSSLTMTVRRDGDWHSAENQGLEALTRSPHLPSTHLLPSNHNFHLRPAVPKALYVPLPRYSHYGDPPVGGERPGDLPTGNAFASTHPTFVQLLR